MEQNELIQALQPLSDALAGIHSILRESMEASRTLQQEAMAVLEAHKESAKQYLQTVEAPEPIDTHPFQELPAGTSARDLPDGGIIFHFSDGSNILVNPDGSLVANSAEGESTVLAPTGGGKVMLPDGRELDLAPGSIQLTQESTGIEGLPVGVEPIKVADTRYRIDLPSGVRIDVEQQRRIVMVCDVSGSILAIGIDRIEGYAEEVDVRLLANHAKGFQAKESGHKGMVEADATVHLSLSQGQNLTFRFPGQAEQPDGASDMDAQTRRICEAKE